MIAERRERVRTPARPRRPLSLRREAARKAVHLATIAVPIAALWAPRPLMTVALVAAVTTAVAIEWARFANRWARYRFLRSTRGMLRSHERRAPAGATYLAVSYLIAYLVFPLPVAVTAMLYSGLGDAAAALVGTRWGRLRTRWGKSWEGTAAGFVTDLGVGLAVPGMPVAAAIVGAFAAAGLEFAPLPVDDNLRVTLGGGAVAWAVWLLVAPLGAA